MRHMPFAVTPGARDRWLELMDRALVDAALPADAEALLREFFGGVANMLMNQPG
jgi:hemoglobin